MSEEKGQKEKEPTNLAVQGTPDIDNNEGKGVEKGEAGVEAKEGTTKR